MILAAPLVIPFAEAVGISIATLGMAKAADMVNDYIQENPEQSIKILSTIVPGVGIGEIFMKKGKDEEVEEEVEVEDVDARDLTRAEKAKEMKRRFKEGTGDKREIGKKGYEEIILPGKEDEMLDEAEDRYEGGVEEVSKPKFDYKKFFKKRYADGGSIGIEVLFEEKKPRKDFSIGGQARPTDRVYDPRANVEDFTKALKSVSAGTTYQQQRQAQDYARQDASRRLSEAMRSGNQANIQGILQGVGGITSIPGMQFNRSGNRVTSVPATGPGRDKIINAMAQQMLNYTPSYQSLKPQPRDNLGLLMQDTIITDQMKSPAEMDAIRDRVLAAQKAQEQSYFMTDPVTGKKYSTEAEAIDDLGLVTYNQRFADGGRVGLFMGGDPLTGQALAIYNSMNAYGFDDQAIADALQAQGLYTAGGSSTPETTAPNIINQQLQTGGGGDNNFGGQGIGAFGNLDPNTLKTMQVEVADGMGGTKIVEKQTALTAGGLRRTLDNKNPVNAGIDVKPMAITIMEALMGKKTDDEFDPAGKIYGTFNNPNYKDLSFFGKIKADYSRQKELKQLQKEFELQEKLKAQIAEEQKQAAFSQARSDRDRAISSGLDAAIREGRDTSGFDRPDSGAYAEGAGMGVGGGYGSDYGFLKDGGLATMFT